MTIEEAAAELDAICQSQIESMRRCRREQKGPNIPIERLTPTVPHRVMDVILDYVDFDHLPGDWSYLGVMREQAPTSNCREYPMVWLLAVHKALTAKLSPKRTAPAATKE